VFNLEDINSSSFRRRESWIAGQKRKSLSSRPEKKKNKEFSVKRKQVRVRK